MPNYYLRQNLLTSNSPTIIKNEQQQSVFLMVGRWGTRGDVLSLYHMNGEVAASIKQTTFVFPIGTRFDLYEGLQKVGSLHQLLSLQRDFYFVHQLGWVVVGDIANHRYTIYHLNKKIMHMQEVSMLTGHFYLIAVENEQDAPLCICIAAVLNYWVLTKKPLTDRLKIGWPHLETN